MNCMRRKDREISQQETVEILDKAEYGVLSTVDKNGQPYGIPLNYVYKDNAIYFHCAVVGQKLDNLAHNSKVSFCVTGSTTVLPETFGTLFESAVVFGTAGEVLDPETALEQRLQRSPVLHWWDITIHPKTVSL